MLRRFSINFALFSMALDALLILLALTAASQLRPYLSFLPYAADVRMPMELPVLLYPLFSLIWLLVFTMMSVYDGKRNLRMTDEITSVSLGSLLAGVSLAGLLYFSYRDVSRVLFLAFVLLAILMLVGWRILVRVYFRYLNSQTAAQKKVLIVGAGQIGRQVEEKINAHAYFGISVAGYLDDDLQKRRRDASILGCLDEARSIVVSRQIDDVIIALPSRAYDKINCLVNDLYDLPVTVRVVPEYYDRALVHARLEELAGIPMLDLRAPALTDYQRLVKRGFDLFFSILILPLSLILMGLIALLIRLEGPGPILFRQKRVGENSRQFEMLKFRTMVANAEELRHLVEETDPDGKLIHKKPGDPRVTRVGRFLRRTSLDELPQLFNVLKGDMSWIGPRPELPYLVERYEPWQRKRLAVPPGITGWWQVNGRSDRPMHLYTQDDLYYVENYSLLLDVQILLKTIGVVLRGRGAF